MKQDRKNWKEMVEEEEVMTRPFDPRVARRLFRWARPYRALIAVIILAILLSTVAELTIPQITRRGIDHYIVVAASPLDLERLDPEARKGLRAELGEGLVPLSGEEAPRFLLPPEAYRELDSAWKRQIDDSGGLG